MSRTLHTLLLAALFASLLGCGDEKTVIPTGSFSDAEKKAIQADDAQIAEQEGGKVKKKK